MLCGLMWQSADMLQIYQMQTFAFLVKAPYPMLTSILTTAVTTRATVASTNGNKLFYKLPTKYFGWHNYVSFGWNKYNI